MKVVVNNMVVWYEDVGNGPILLCLHGWQDNLHSFDGLIRELDGFRIIRLDLPGFGQSDDPFTSWVLDDYVSFINDFILAIKVKPNFLLGHSFGGRIITKGQATNKFSTEKVVLIGSAGLYKGGTARNILIKAASKIGKFITYIPPLIFFRKNIKNYFYKKIGSDYLGAKDFLRQTFLNIIQEDLEEYFRLIMVPTLIIWGREDSQTPLKDGEFINSLIKESTLKVVDDASHFVHKEKPELVANYIKDFL